MLQLTENTALLTILRPILGTAYMWEMFACNGWTNSWVPKATQVRHPKQSPISPPRFTAAKARAQLKGITQAPTPAPHEKGFKTRVNINRSLTAAFHSKQETVQQPSGRAHQQQPHVHQLQMSTQPPYSTCNACNCSHMGYWGHSIFLKQCVVHRIISKTHHGTFLQAAPQSSKNNPVFLSSSIKTIHGHTESCPIPPYVTPLTETKKNPGKCH